MLNDYGRHALANVIQLLREAAMRDCNMTASMQLIINVMARHIDTQEKLEAFLCELTDEYNNNILSIIPPASNLLQ